MTYEVFDQRDTRLWTGEDTTDLHSYLAARSRRPPLRGTRPYTLWVTATGQPAVILKLRMDITGRITVVEICTTQPVAEVSLEEILANLLRLVPPPIYTPPSTARSVWERLRDKWPVEPPPIPEPPSGWSAAEWESLVRWEPESSGVRREAEAAAQTTTDHVTYLVGLRPDHGNQYDASALGWAGGCYFPERERFRLADGRTVTLTALDVAYDSEGDVAHVTYGSGDGVRVVVVND